MCEIPVGYQVSESLARFKTHRIQLQCHVPKVPRHKDAPRISLPSSAPCRGKINQKS